MNELREVRIVVGKRSYRIRTALDEDTLKRVTAVAAELCDANSEALDQESRLLLSCLQLAYTLDGISRRVEPFMKRLDALDSFVWDDSSSKRRHYGQLFQGIADDEGASD